MDALAEATAVEDKPKTALDWIRWGAEQKRKGGAAPAAEHSAAPKTDSAHEPPAPLTAEPTDREAVLPDLMRRSPEPELAPPAESAEETAEEPPDRAPRAIDDLVEEVEEGEVEDGSEEVIEVDPEPEVEDAPPSPPVLEAEDVSADEIEDIEELEEAEEIEEIEHTVAEAVPAPPPAPPPAPVQPRTPAARNSLVVVPEGTPYTFAVDDFQLVEGDGYGIAELKIVSLAGVGAMRFRHDQIILGQRISRADITAGHFAFLPGTAGTGATDDSFLFKVSDGQTWSRVAYTMTVQTAPSED